MERYELVDDCPPTEIWNHYGVWDWYRDQLAELDGQPCRGMLKARAQQALERLLADDADG